MCLLGVRIACELILPQELLTLDVGSIYPGYDGDLNEVQCIYIYIYICIYYSPYHCISSHDA